MKALLPRWRVLRKKHDWVTCGSDLFDGALGAETVFVFFSEEAKERFFWQDGGNGEKKNDWVTCGKDLQSTPDNSNLHGKSKKSWSYRELKENSRD